MSQNQSQKPPPTEAEAPPYDEMDHAMMTAPTYIGISNRLAWRGGMVRFLFCDRPEERLPIKHAVCVAMSMEDAQALYEGIGKMLADRPMSAGVGVLQHPAKASVN